MSQEGKSSKLNLPFLISTFFGLGLFPIMPGTIGSIATFPIYFIIIFSIILSRGGGSLDLTSPEMMNFFLLIIAIIFFVGAWASAEYEKQIKKNDPKEIIIDEIVGQLLTITLLLYFIPNIKEEIHFLANKMNFNPKDFIYVVLLFSFISFRIFDITKPWPISYFDRNIKGGFGIMIDDVFAAIIASLSFYSLFYIFIDFIQ